MRKRAARGGGGEKEARKRKKTKKNFQEKTITAVKRQLSIYSRAVLIGAYNSSQGGGEKRGKEKHIAREKKHTGRKKR